MSKTNFPIQVSSLDELSRYNITKIASAIGVFDGIHLGHRELIKELIKTSNKLSATPVVITFSPHPRKVLFPDKPLHFLRTPAKKAKILGDLGIKAIVTVPFTLEFASLSPYEFIEKFMLPRNIKLLGICVGTKWTFGARAKGNEQTLHDFADKYGFIFKSVKETFWNGQPISSTAIRSALAKGDFSSANYMLNTKYIITGHIISFNKVKNSDGVSVKVDFGILPPIGEYIVYINNNRSVEIIVNVISQTELSINSLQTFSANNQLEIEFQKENP